MFGMPKYRIYCKPLAILMCGMPKSRIYCKLLLQGWEDKIPRCKAGEQVKNYLSYLNRHCDSIQTVFFVGLFDLNLSLCNIDNSCFHERLIFTDFHESVQSNL
jgi:hypothetical protein